MTEETKTGFVVVEQAVRPSANLWAALDDESVDEPVVATAARKRKRSKKQQAHEPWWFGWLPLVAAVAVLVPALPPPLHPLARFRPPEPGIVFVRPLPESVTDDRTLEWRLAPSLASAAANSKVQVQVWIDDVPALRDDGVLELAGTDDLTLSVAMPDVLQFGIHNATVSMVSLGNKFPPVRNSSLFIG